MYLEVKKLQKKNDMVDCGKVKRMLGKLQLVPEYKGGGRWRGIRSEIIKLKSNTDKSWSSE